MRPCLGGNESNILNSVPGRVTAALSDTVETQYAGWQTVGLSVLLIAFFQERPSPPRNGLRV